VSGVPHRRPVIVGARTRWRFLPRPVHRRCEDCTITDSEIEYSIVLRARHQSGSGGSEASLSDADVESRPAAVPKAPPTHSRRSQQGGRSAHEDPGNRRADHRLAYVRTYARGVIPATAGRVTVWTSLPMRATCQPGSGRREPAAALRPGRHLRRSRCSRRCSPGTTRCSTSPPRRMWTGPSTAPPIRRPRTGGCAGSAAGLPRRGGWSGWSQVSTDEVYRQHRGGPWNRGCPARAELPVSAAKAAADLMPGPTPGPTG